MPFPLAVENVEREMAGGSPADLLEGTVITVDGDQLMTLQGIARLTNRGLTEARQLTIREGFPPFRPTPPRSTSAPRSAPTSVQARRPSL